MKIITFIVLFFTAVYNLKSQSADTLLIRLTYYHNVVEGKYTRGIVTTRQQFMTPDEQIFREINYDKETKQITDYTFFFYEDTVLTSKEQYNSGDSLIQAIKYMYDQKGNNVSTIKYGYFSGFLQGLEKTMKAYNAYGKLITEKHVKAGKLNNRIQYFYDDHGKLVKEVHKNQKPYADGIKSEVKEFKYNAQGKRESMICNQKNVQNELIYHKETFSYDSTGMITEVKTTDGENKLVKTQIYKYLPGGYLSVEQETDHEGKITRLLQYDYKKHFMDAGTQISVFKKYPIK